MNILFLQRSIAGFGGVMVVTNTLAKKMIEEGHNVSQVVFLQPNEYAISQMDKRIHQYVIGSLNFSSENIKSFKKVLVKEKVDIIINQWGLNLQMGRLLKKGIKGTGIKVISVYHNQPDKNGRIVNIENQLKCDISKAKRAVKLIELLAFKILTSYSFRYIYRISDLFLVLSDRFIPIFKKVSWMNNPKKLISQTNPLTIDNKEFVYDFNKKKMQIIYVGRLDETQKCVSRILAIWRELCGVLPNWNLKLVGDGPDRKLYEQYIDKNGLKNISIEGFCNPLEYYKESSILLLTSDFEGFPLVLAEAMSFGVIPIVYGSYEAIYDIIDDNNGFIIRAQNEDELRSEFIDHILLLAHNKVLRQEMALHAIEQAMNYSIDYVYKKWNYYLNVLFKEK